MKYVHVASASAVSPHARKCVPWDGFPASNRQISRECDPCAAYSASRRKKRPFRRFGPLESSFLYSETSGLAYGPSNGVLQWRAHAALSVDGWLLVLGRSCRGARIGRDFENHRASPRPLVPRAIGSGDCVFPREGAFGTFPPDTGSGSSSAMFQAC